MKKEYEAKKKEISVRKSIGKNYADRERKAGRGDEYNAHRSMVRKFHSTSK